MTTSGFIFAAEMFFTVHLFYVVAFNTTLTRLRKWFIRTFLQCYSAQYIYIYIYSLQKFAESSYNVTHKI